MNVTDIKSRTVKTYMLTIDGGEVRPQPYTRTGRQYRVQHIEVIKRDGNVSQVALSGAVLKKDGSEGLNGCTERLYSERDWPTWLRGIVGGLA